MQPRSQRLRRIYVRAVARLPRPARLLWIFLAVLGVYGIIVNLAGLGLVSLLALPALALETDVVFQFLRYRGLRAPDTALATGLFLALLLPPTVSLFEAAAVVTAAVSLRHVLRVQGRPLFNPAVVGVLLGAVFFGMAPSWWAAISLVLVVVFGVTLTLRTPGSWRMPAAFLAAYAPLSVLLAIAAGRALAPQVLLLGVLDPAILFFALFMVPEPRASPTDPFDRMVFGGAVGMATALLPAALPSLAPLVALLLGNVLAAYLRHSEAAAAPQPSSNRKKRARREARRRVRRKETPATGDALGSWTTARRVAAGFLVFAVIGGMSVASHTPTSTPFSAIRPSSPTPISGDNVTSSCTQDNPSLSSSLLSFLHQRLGPSVVLSADQNSGTVVFYDPVNHVTVTETDMYEDYGFAEFNGDDYAVAGCSA